MEQGGAARGRLLHLQGEPPKGVPPWKEVEQGPGPFAEVERGTGSKGMNALIPGHLRREGVVVTPWEAMAYDELCRAAHAGEVCPLNLDLEMLLECNSTSVAPSVVKRLERKGSARSSCRRGITPSLRVAAS